MSDGAGSESWAYDAMGRVLADERTTDSVTWTFDYTYNLDGTAATLDYPSGLDLSCGYNNAGEPTALGDQNSDVYATGATYAPTGGLSSATLDATANFAGFSYTAGYNSDLQASGIAAGFGSTSVVNLGYCYYALSSGECPSSGTSDNGDVVGVLNNLDGTRSQTFSYDSLNRLSTAASVNTSGTRCWGEQFGYDAWGNLLTIGALSGYSSCAQPDNLSLTVNGANQISDSGFTYDADGRLTGESPGLGTLTYNAEGELTAAGGVDYGYDGDGARVEKSSGASEIDWYGGSGGVLEQTDLSGNLQYDYIFFDGQAVASLDSSGDVYATFGDGLGSTREVEEIASGASSPTSVFDADYYPFGRENDFVDTFNPSFQFTGKQRDPETGSDYFGARYTNYTLGRFLTPDWSADPEPVPYATIGDPQSLNLYSYVENNPESGVDPDGHWCVLGFIGTSCDPAQGSNVCATVDGSGGGSCTTTDFNNPSQDPSDLSSIFQILREAPNWTLSELQSLTSAFDAKPGPPSIASMASGAVCTAAAAAIGAGTGAILGEGLGALAAGAGGTFVAPGVGTVAGGAAGYAGGAAGGAALGGAVGGMVGSILCSSGGADGGGSGSTNNRRQNQQARDARHEAERRTGKKFTPELEQMFHREITGMNYSYQEIIEIAVDILEAHG